MMLKRDDQLGINATIREDEFSDPMIFAGYVRQRIELLGGTIVVRRFVKLTSLRICLEGRGMT
jgi:hypothetical protein